LFGENHSGFIKGPSTSTYGTRTWMNG